MTILDAPLQQSPIPIGTQDEIVHQLWDRKPSIQLQHDDLDWAPYFVYYTDQCIQALHDRGRHISARSHQDLANVAHLFKKNHDKNTIKTVLQANFTTPRSETERTEMLEGSVNLAARLVAMMDIGVLHLGYTGRRHLVWDDGSLKDFVCDYFTQPVLLSHESVKLEKIFTARNFGRIAGMRIVWTNNLADHLRVTGEDDKEVAIFHYASFLKWQNRSS
jgi:hypothetical protein